VKASEAGHPAEPQPEPESGQDHVALRLRDAALGAISQGVVIIDAQRRTIYVNAAFEAMTGYTAAEMSGRPYSILQGVDSDVNAIQRLKQALDNQTPFEVELLNYRKDGTPFWSELSITPMFDTQGALCQFVAVQRDVTALVQGKAQLLLAAEVFEQSGEGIIITDAARNIVRVNRAFTDITGYSESEVLGRNPRMLSSGRHDGAYYHAMHDALDRFGSWQGEIWNRRKDGSFYPEWLSLSRVVDDQGQITNYVACFADITLRKAAEQRIDLLAHYDPLTGLPNRILLYDRVHQALAAARRDNTPVTLMFIDLDHFKLVNDSLGHRVGDCLLKAVAARLTASLREQDTVSRVGGDEFLVLLPGTGVDSAAHVADKLLQAARRSFQIDDHELNITPSIGIATYPVDGQDCDALARCADAAMYCAKRDGRNTYRRHSEEIEAHSTRVQLLQNALQRALKRNQLQLHYQPQKCLRSGKVIGVEALLRWHHPELGWVPPGEFISIAETSGLIIGIGEWVLRTAMGQMKAWLDAGMAPLTMAVNLSAVQLRQQNLPELVSAILADCGVAAECLELELTESVASEDPLGASVAIDRLKSCGVRVAIDDFGTGYSSLSYLKRFSVYKLKIDQSFVQGVTNDTDDQAIVRAVIALARGMGVRTIAEGVETAAQMDYLREQGCDEMQGYWLSRPLPPDQFKAFVDARSAGLATSPGADFAAQNALV